MWHHNYMCIKGTIVHHFITLVQHVMLHLLLQSLHRSRAVVEMHFYAIFLFPETIWSKDDAVLHNVIPHSPKRFSNAACWSLILRWGNSGHVWANSRGSVLLRGIPLLSLVISQKIGWPCLPCIADERYRGDEGEMMEKWEGLIVCCALRFNEGSECGIGLLCGPVVQSKGRDIRPMWKN